MLQSWLHRKRSCGDGDGDGDGGGDDKDHVAVGRGSEADRVDSDVAEVATKEHA